MAGFPWPASAGIHPSPWCSDDACGWAGPRWPGSRIAPSRLAGASGGGGRCLCRCGAGAGAGSGIALAPGPGAGHRAGLWRHSPTAPAGCLDQCPCPDGRRAPAPTPALAASCGSVPDPLQRAGARVGGREHQRRPGAAHRTGPAGSHGECHPPGGAAPAGGPAWPPGSLGWPQPPRRPRRAPGAVPFAPPLVGHGPARLAAGGRSRGLRPGRCHTAAPRPADQPRSHRPGHPAGGLRRGRGDRRAAAGSPLGVNAAGPFRGSPRPARLPGRPLVRAGSPCPGRGAPPGPQARRADPRCLRRAGWQDHSDRRMPAGPG